MFKKMLTGGALVAAVALAGCGSKGADEIISQMKGFKDKACACKDAECADKVNEEMVGWMMKNADKYKDTKGSKSQEEDAKKVMEEMQKCMEKLKAPEGGEAPPAGDAPK